MTLHAPLWSWVIAVGLDAAFWTFIIRRRARRRMGP